jgi:hypothetical protein
VVLLSSAESARTIASLVLCHRDLIFLGTMKRYTGISESQHFKADFAGSLHQRLAVAAFAGVAPFGRKPAMIGFQAQLFTFQE